MNAGMNKLYDLLGQTHPDDDLLDRVSRMLVPHVPDAVHHILRAPLKQWHSGTVKFLREPGEFTLQEFACSWMLLAAMYPPSEQRWICFMTCSLFQILDIATLELGLIAPEAPDSEALRRMNAKLFGPNPGSVFTPLYSEARH